MAIANKLAHILETKNAIKEALVSKGAVMSATDTFRSYADKISSIETGNKQITLIDTYDGSSKAPEMLFCKINDDGTVEEGITAENFKNAGKYNMVIGGEVVGTIVIDKKTPTKADFDVTIPVVIYDGNPHNVETPIFKEGLTGGGEISVLYYEKETNTLLTTAPIDVGEYIVRLSVTEGENFNRRNAFSVGTLIIKENDKLIKVKIYNATGEDNAVTFNADSSNFECTGGSARIVFSVEEMKSIKKISITSSKLESPLTYDRETDGIRNEELVFDLNTVGNYTMSIEDEYDRVVIPGTGKLTTIRVTR